MGKRIVPVRADPALSRNSSKCVLCRGANTCDPSSGYPSCMICLSPSSSAAISSFETTPIRLRSRSFEMALIWSLTATAGHPSQRIGMRIGGLAFGELDSGTTITVLRLSFKTFTVITTHGRVLLISGPSVGSSCTHQISPRSGITSTAHPFRQ